MNSKKWKVAVVGCGFFANAQYLPFIEKEANAECVAAVDIVFERAQQACEKYGIPNAYKDVYELIEKCDFDIVIDAASIQAHHEINMAVLNAGKHLISQKPAAPTVEKLTEQIELAKQKRVKFACAPVHNMRYDLNFAKQLIEDGAIGNAYYAKCNSSHGGPEYFQFRDADPTWFFKEGAGALVDMGVHGLQQVTYILGAAKRVTCVGTVTTPVRQVRSGAFDGKLINTDELPDQYLISLEFDNGKLAFVDCGFSQKASKDPFLQIFGDEGTISLTKPYMTNPVPSVYIDSKERGIRGWMEPQQGVKVYDKMISQCCILKDIINAIENDEQPMLSPEHARHVLEIMCAIPQSLSEHRAIELKTDF